MKNRDHKVKNTINILEKNVKLLGITGVEDKL